MAGLTLPNVLRARAAAAESRQPKNNKSLQNKSLKNKSVILYWLDGGPTHFETYDPKPDAPAEYRGPLGTIKTNVEGILLSELLVKHAKQMDKVSILRSVHHDNGDHFAAGHWMLTGYFGSSASSLDPQFPSVGAIVSRVRGAQAKRTAKPKRQAPDHEHAQRRADRTAQPVRQLEFVPQRGEFDLQRLSHRLRPECRRPSARGLHADRCEGAARC